MNALFNPVNRTGRGINWGLVAHTAAMFSFVTIYTALNFQLQSISYINNREYPQEGPFGYQFFVESKPINVVPNIMFMLNNWLADGLLVSSMQSSVAQVANQVAPLAISLLCRLCYELLVRCLPMLNVHRCRRYVPESYSKTGGD